MKVFRSVNHVHLFALVCVWALASTAIAGGIGGALGGLGGSMPWDSSLSSLRSSFQTAVGPTLLAIGIVVTCGSVIASGEMQEFGRRGPAMIAGGAGVMGVNALINMFSSGGLIR